MDLQNKEQENLEYYGLVYKCQICGTLMQFGAPIQMTKNDLPEFLGKVIQNQLFAGNPYLHKAPMQVPHKCPNGGCGMAYFAGLIPTIHCSNGKNK